MTRAAYRSLLHGRRYNNPRQMNMLKWNLFIFVALYIAVGCQLPMMAMANDENAQNSRSRYLNLLEEENGVKVLVNEDSFQQALEEGAIGAFHESAHPPQLLLTLVTASSCPHSAALLATIEQAIPLVEAYFQDPRRQASLEHQPRPLFGKLDGSKVTAEEDPLLLQRMGVVAYPTLLFVSNVVAVEDHHSNRIHHRHHHHDGDDEDMMSMKLLFLDYLGLQATPQDIADTVLLYYYRMVLAPRHYYKDMIHVLPIPFATLHQVQEFVQQHQPGLLRQTRSLNLSPELSPAERDYITWLLEPEQRNEGTDQDDLIVFVQCRDHDNKIVDDHAAMLTTVFDEMSSLLSSRPDRAFFSVGDCSQEQLQARDVVAYRLPPSSDTTMTAVDWNELPQVSYLESTTSSSTAAAAALDLKTFLVQQATPSVLWFDRQSTAPIVFHKSRKVHAVLFVDFHQPLLQHHDSGHSQNVSSHQHHHEVRQQEVVRQFQKACRQHQQHRMDDDMACLIVPSTETRILTTFGIDIWSRWDANVTSDHARHVPLETTTTKEETAATPASSPLPETLPVVLLTDQRVAGNTLRYYLEPAAIFSKPTAISEFVQDFWSNRLKPEILSSSPPSRARSSKRKGRAIALTGQTFDTEFVQHGSRHHHQHRLVLFYAPTCGHCKRFFLIWNQLAELLRYIEWDSFMTLYKMDVTENEIHHPAEWNMSMQWLPDLYYFPPNSMTDGSDDDTKVRERPIRYNLEDARGDGVGRLNHPLEVVEWLLDVGDFDESALLNLLETEDAAVESTQQETTVLSNDESVTEGATTSD